MTCLRENEQGADLLIGYLEGTLPETDRAELDRHAAACAECRALLQVQEDLDEFEAPEVSADFDARLYARIAGEQEKKPWWQRALWRPMVPVAAAAALAVVLIVRTPAPVEPAIKAVNDPQIEMIEQALEDMELLMPLETPGDAL